MAHPAAKDGNFLWTYFEGLGHVILLCLQILQILRLNVAGCPYLNFVLFFVLRSWRLNLQERGKMAQESYEERAELFVASNKRVEQNTVFKHLLNWGGRKLSAQILCLPAYHLTSTSLRRSEMFWCRGPTVHTRPSTNAAKDNTKMTAARIVYCMQYTFSVVAWNLVFSLVTYWCTQGGLLDDDVEICCGQSTLKVGIRAWKRFEVTKLTPAQWCLPSLLIFSWWKAPAFCNEGESWLTQTARTKRVFR